MLIIFIILISLYIAWSDISQRRIPNVSQYIILLVAFVSKTIHGSESVDWDFFITPAVILSVGALLSRCNVVGFGDIKLIFTTLLVTSAQYHTAVILLTVFSGGVWAILWHFILSKISLVKKIDKVQQGIPYGIPIVLSLCLFTSVH